MLRVLIAFAVLITAATAPAQSPGGEGIRRLQDRAAEFERQMEGLKDFTPSEKMRSEARKAHELFEKRQSELEDFEEQITRTLLGVAPEEILSAAGLKDRSRKSTLRPDERIYLFVSSSVPVRTLRNYARDLEAMGEPRALMVMRGFVGGIRRFGPTREFLLRVLKRDPDCDHLTERCSGHDVQIWIDPLLFRRFGIEEVPAFVYVRGLSVRDPTAAESDPENASFGRALLLRGDVPLDYFLEVLFRETRDERFETLRRRITGGS